MICSVIAISISYGTPVRPDEYLEAESSIFMQDSMDDIYASGKMDEGDRGYTSTLEADGRTVFGGLRIYETGGHKYLIESVVTAESFAGYYTLAVAVYLSKLFVIETVIVWLGLPLTITKLIAEVLLFIVTYFVQHNIIFKKKSKKKSENK